MGKVAHRFDFNLIFTYLYILRKTVAWQWLCDGLFVRFWRGVGEGEESKKSVFVVLTNFVFCRTKKKYKKMKNFTKTP